MKYPPKPSDICLPNGESLAILIDGIFPTWSVALGVIRLGSGCHSCGNYPSHIIPMLLWLPPPIKIFLGG